ncbi:cerebellin-1-like [Crassostrea virginica]
MSEAIGRLESMVADLMTDNRKLKQLTSELARCLEEETMLRKQLEQRIGGQGHGIIPQSWEGGSRTDIGGEIPVFETSPKSTQKRAVLRSSNDTIAFSAYMTTRKPSPGNLHTLVFDAIFTNEGNGYNHHLGVFIAPKSALYVFTWTIRANNGAYFNTQLLVNGLVYGSMFTRDANYPNSNSATAVVRVAAGIAVYVRTGPASNYGDIISSFDGYSTFSGWSID